MARIKQLSPQEAQKIAAGEVVERPANVVKELVENALDAGATAIAIYIQDAGKSLIRIVDNGCGMNQEDAHLCFKHHATSKITRVDDLPTLSTFGFRGEALSSISAVSNVTLITKEYDASQGIKLVLDQGTIISEELISANTGTDMSIANLFFNVPARKKFLKTNDTESRQITLLFQAFCLDYLSVHFKLITQGNIQFNCPPVADMQQRVAQIWDHAIAQQTLPLLAEKNGIRIEGVISNHTYSRYDRSALYFFVNRRWIKNHALSKALLKGYMNVLQPDKFPLACINISIDPAQVDINIHPRKEEVQFLHPRIIEQMLQTAVKENLEKYLSAQLNKKVSFAEPTSTFTGKYIQQNGSINLAIARHSPRTDLNISPTTQAPFTYLEEFPTPFVSSRRSSGAMADTLSSQMGVPARRPSRCTFGAPQDDRKDAFTPELAEGLGEGWVEGSLENNSYISDPLVLSRPKHSSEISKPIAQISQQTEYQIIGQFKKTYILIEQDESLFLVDQHAAHERILYEIFATRFNQVATIGLLFPQIISINPEDIGLIEPHLEIFNANHITLERMGAHQLIVQAIPVHLKEVNIEELVFQTIGWIKEYHKLDVQEWYKKVHEKLHAQMACKAAVKAGDQLTVIQMQQLLHDLEKIENRFTCPHGRPTGWALPLYEIEKKFKRKL